MDPNKKPIGRAVTDEEKRLVIEEIYTAWCRSKDLRLGQFLMNVATTDVRLFHIEELFHIEDELLAERAMRYAAVTELGR